MIGQRNAAWRVLLKLAARIGISFNHRTMPTAFCAPLMCIGAILAASLTKARHLPQS
jgi:hypothetical protein